ncbi:nitrile hydratase subunit alpha [Streptomyces anthocyanicus]|uniref:nitrile hydratase subunit alpha n=1 Tax=Streptomyces TaxID=1883 RepID=UPI0029A4B171|nr:MULTISPECIES: nitrile hydratase subunit alpha [Streptomyces]MDX3349398.1 nitrile hydratase subunit alpha [Streptomyces sp. ME02-6979A]
MRHDTGTAHTLRLVNDSAYRARLIADPKAVLCEESGHHPREDFAVEVLEQRDDTVVILLPAKPEDDEDFEERLAEASQRVYDVLFSSGVGGFLIPDDRLKWILRDIRSSWAARTEPQG